MAAGVGSGGGFDLALSLAALAGVLFAAVAKPARLPESVAAVAAAALVLAVGAVSLRHAADELDSLAPALVFLAAVLVLGACCAREGVFRALGSWLARSRRGPAGLLLGVFLVGTAVTNVLSLDATVVLLTPVVLAAVDGLRVPPAPYVYGAGHVANSGSLLLPSGNLTNLLAFSAAGVTLVHFAGLMLLPQLLVLAVEYGMFRAFFRSDLRTPPAPGYGEDVLVPRFALLVLGLTLVGFVVASLAGVQPYWSAIAGAVALVVHLLATRETTVADVARSVDVPFLLFVSGLAVVVRAVVDNGLGDVTGRLMPTHASLLSLLATAGVGMVLANVVNNLPALLILLPTAASVGTLAVLAVLIGVNVGPNLSYPGSLATLLWRRVLREHGLTPSLRRFTTLGLLTAPACVAVGVVGLWVAGQV